MGHSKLLIDLHMAVAPGGDSLHIAYLRGIPYVRIALHKFIETRSITISNKKKKKKKRIKEQFWSFQVLLGFSMCVCVLAPVSSSGFKLQLC